MKKALKSFIGSPRIGATVGKTLLFLWLKRDLKKMRGELGVDLAGGSMFNYKFFNTDEYVCVDINQAKLDKGKNKYPNTIAVNSRMQEFMKNNNQKKANVLLCVQTIGINIYFEHDEAIKVIKQMYDFLKTDGNMIFNIGLNKEISKIENEINIFLKDKFKSIEVKSYGALHRTAEKKKSQFSFNQYVYFNAFLRIILAYIMDIFPPLRTFFGFKKKKIYVVCRKKL